MTAAVEDRGYRGNTRAYFDCQRICTRRDPECDCRMTKVVRSKRDKSCNCESRLPKTLTPLIERHGSILRRGKTPGRLVHDSNRSGGLAGFPMFCGDGKSVRSRDTDHRRGLRRPGRGLAQSTGSLLCSESGIWDESPYLATHLRITLVLGRLLGPSREGRCLCEVTAISSARTSPLDGSIWVGVWKASTGDHESWLRNPTWPGRTHTGVCWTTIDTRFRGARGREASVDAGARSWLAADASWLSAPMWWCRRSDSIASRPARSLRPSRVCIRTHQW